MEGNHDPNIPSSQERNILSIIKSTYNDTATYLYKIHQHNITTFRRQPLSEISGSFGDIGTLLPLLIALTVQDAISLTSTLVFSGLANIVTGVVFGIPLPVQPMKAIAAVAIAQHFTLSETISAGMFVAAAVTFLALTGLIRWFTNVIPLPVIKGIQVGTGLSLIISAGGIYDKHLSTNNWIVFLAFLALLASSTVFRRVPYALIILIIGILAVIIFNPSATIATSLTISSSNHTNHNAHKDYDDKNFKYFKIWHPHPFIPSPSAFAKGTLNAGIGQLPLTTLNSVIAVSFLAADLFPHSHSQSSSPPQHQSQQPPTPSTTAIALSVGLFNLLGTWFGAMPICHGSGGLAAQYRFSARSGASVIFLGVVKLLLGLFASGVAEVVVGGFPGALLCVMLVAAGLELSAIGEGLNAVGARDLRAVDAMVVERNRNDGDDGGDRDGDGDGIITREDSGALISYANNDGRLFEGKRVAVVDLTGEQRKRRWTVMLMTVAGILAFGNDALGFVAGILCHWSFLLQDRWEDRMRGRIVLGDA